MHRGEDVIYEVRMGRGTLGEQVAADDYTEPGELGDGLGEKAKTVRELGVR